MIESLIENITADPGSEHDLRIGLTPEQHQAIQRDDMPPGDAYGRRLKEFIRTIHDQRLADNPKAGVHVYVRRQSRPAALGNLLPHRQHP